MIVASVSADGSIDRRKGLKSTLDDLECVSALKNRHARFNLWVHGSGQATHLNPDKIARNKCHLVHRKGLGGRHIDKWMLVGQILQVMEHHLRLMQYRSVTKGRKADEISLKQDIVSFRFIKI
jgi:hypothetical protein